MYGFFALFLGGEFKGNKERVFVWHLCYYYCTMCIVSTTRLQLCMLEKTCMRDLGNGGTTTNDTDEEEEEPGGNCRRGGKKKGLINFQVPSSLSFPLRRGQYSAP